MRSLRAVTMSFLQRLSYCAGAAVSAIICGCIVTRKINAYADALKKASDTSESRSKQKEQEEQGNPKISKSAPQHEAIVRPRTRLPNNEQAL